MIATRNNAATITLPSDRELVITREFAAPRRLVFEAMTKPEHVKQWYGMRIMTMPVCQIDLRPGGVEACNAVKKFGAVEGGHQTLERLERYLVNDIQE